MTFVRSITYALAFSLLALAVTPVHAASGHNATETAGSAAKLKNSSTDPASALNPQWNHLLDDAVSALKQRIQAGLPFQLDERLARVDHLEKMPSHTDDALAEKTRRVIEAYRIELDYAKTVEAYRDVLIQSGDGRLVNFLRIGHLALYYQTINGLESGVWQPRQQKWLRLSGEQNEAIRQALRIARKIEPPQLMVLPLFVPDVSTRPFGDTKGLAAQTDNPPSTSQPQAEPAAQALLETLRAPIADLQASLSQPNGNGIQRMFERVLDSRQAIGADALAELFRALQSQLDKQGRIYLESAPVYSGNGEVQEQAVLHVGGFTRIAAGRYLAYWPEVDKLVELPRQPAPKLLALAGAFTQQPAASLAPLAIDPSSGQILQMVVEIPNVEERIAQGGTVGYLILALAAVACLLSVYRFIDLNWIGKRIRRQMQSSEYRSDNPLGRVLSRIDQVQMQDEELLYLAVDDALSVEQSRLNQALPFLKLVAAIAPMLGLLGTVTGMIETFQAIALQGSGDPKLMSGGISEALVTTVEGLVTAIPILLVHSLLVSKSQALGTLLEARATAELTLRIESWHGAGKHSQ